MSKRQSKHYLVKTLSRADLSELYHSGLFPNSPIADPESHPLILEKGCSFCCKKEGEIRFAGGVVPLWHGVGEVWMVMMEGMEKHGFLLTKVCKQLINEGAKAFHRIQMTTLESEPGHARWAKLLGFQEEGTMIQYGPDRANHVRLSKTWPLKH